jgi:type VII secretion protein EccB
VATRKDQLDAFNFARRRMVANLVVPTATGSDEGAPRPVRTFASSIILSAIAVAAVAVLGVFKPSAPSGWQAGLAVDSNSGAAYITQSNELHAVYNITSARLILGTKFQKFDVPDSTLNGAGITIGSPVGILGAPEDVPSASNMNLTQWSFCQNEKETDSSIAGGSTYLEIGYWPAAGTTQGLRTGGSQGSESALIVHDSQDDVYLVDGDYKYEVGNDKTDHQDVQNLLVAVAQGRSFINPDVTGFYVSDAWLSAFQTGANIAYPEIDDLGGTVTGSDQPGQEIGAYGLDSGSGSGSVQTKKGLAQLSPFAYYLYAANKNLADDHVQQIPQNTLTISEINAANNGVQVDTASVFESGTYGADWPQVAPILYGTDTTATTTANICVGYSGQTTGSASARVPELTTWTSAQLPYGSPTSQFGLTQTGSNLEASTVLVKPGYGLIAQRLSGGSQFLIEDSGYRYALAVDNTPSSGSSSSTSGSSSSSGSDSTVSAKDLLGYHSTAVEQVPDNWVNLIQGGATLDPQQAGETPGTGN